MIAPAIVAVAVALVGASLYAGIRQGRAPLPGQDQPSYDPSCDPKGIGTRIALYTVGGLFMVVVLSAWISGAFK